MKPLKILAILAFCTGLLFSGTSCAVFVKGDNGHHKGHYKNSNNPHSTYSTNPGKAKGSKNNSNNPHNNNSTNPGKSKSKSK